VRALVSRLLRAQLRLKVMAGVVAVTLIALVAFDVTAVAVMRGYLMNQTDENLRVALKLTQMRLHVLVPGYPPKQVVALPGAGARVVKPGSRPPTGVAVRQPPSMPGEFDIAYLPAGGERIALQVGAVPGAQLLFPGNIAKFAAEPGPHTVISPNGRTRIRVEGVTVTGGALVVGASLDQVSRTIGQFELIVILGSVAVVLLIGAGVFGVLRRGLRPVEEMAAQADRITAGDLTERVTPHSPRSEVGRLGAALNGMLARIAASVREREASQEQTRRFFADASHELRTPLASLRANAELYQQGALTSTDQVDEVMRRMALETRRMGQLVDDMLRLARLGQHPGQCRAPVDVTALVNACAERVRMADPARTWELIVAEGLRTVGDEELLGRAVTNLLTNVLVHTPPDTAGKIAAAGAAGQISIEVSDDGPGVPPDKLPHIFDRFYRAGARPQTGSGLGLAIAAEIATAHGGTARAALVSPHGLRVTMTVPAEQEDQDYPERERGDSPRKGVTTLRSG
jgi:two-component system OmpR family sensor kinase